jgi:hypothetical protein
MVYTRSLSEFAAVGIRESLAIAVSNNNDPTGKSIVYNCYAVILIIVGFVLHNGLKGSKLDKPGYIDPH